MARFLCTLFIILTVFLSSLIGSDHLYHGIQFNLGLVNGSANILNAVNKNIDLEFSPILYHFQYDLLLMDEEKFTPILRMLINFGFTQNGDESFSFSDDTVIPITYKDIDRETLGYSYIETMIMAYLIDVKVSDVYITPEVGVCILMPTYHFRAPTTALNGKDGTVYTFGPEEEYVFDIHQDMYGFTFGSTITYKKLACIDLDFAYAPWGPFLAGVGDKRGTSRYVDADNTYGDANNITETVNPKITKLIVNAKFIQLFPLVFNVKFVYNNYTMDGVVPNSFINDTRVMQDEAISIKNTTIGFGASFYL